MTTGSLRETTTEYVCEMNRYTIVAARTSFLDKPDLSAYHATLFHGWARRSGDDTENLEWAGWASLEYIYNTSSRARLVQPRLNFLIQRETYNDLHLEGPFKTLPVVLLKCVNIEFSKGVMPDFDRLDVEDGEYEQLLLQAPACGPKSSRIEFVELCLPRIPPEERGISIAIKKDKFTTREVFTMRAGQPQPDCFWCPAGNAFLTDRFSKLLELVDPDYFDFFTVEI